LRPVFAVGLGVAIERFIYLTVVTRGNRRLWSQLAPQIQSGNFRKAMEIADKNDSSLSTIMKYGISRLPTGPAPRGRRARDERKPDRSRDAIEKRTNMLASLANIGMLMGPARHRHRLINAFAAVSNVKPGREDQPALGEHLGRDEQHRPRASGSRSRCCWRTCISRARPRRWSTASKWPQ
jgi:hypothetical protein